MTILPDTVGLDRVSFRNNDLRYCSDGGVVRRVEEIEREDTKYLRLWFHLGDRFIENNLPEFIDIPVNLVTERVEEITGPGLTTNSTGLELDLGMNSGEDSNHEHENGVHAVHTLPTDAKDGDMCLYAPQNTLTLEDSGKKIYFDWEEFSKPVEEEDNTDLDLYYTYLEDCVIEMVIKRYSDSASFFATKYNLINGDSEGLSVNFDDGVLNTARSKFTIWYGESGKRETTSYNSIDELPRYFDVPKFDQETNYDLTGNEYLFHTEYKLMKYQGGEWVEAVSSSSGNATVTVDGETLVIPASAFLANALDEIEAMIDESGVLDE
jgi:hypothetical protein